jgi:uncharacterized protein YegJ (DUF2314 family)
MGLALVGLLFALGSVFPATARQFSTSEASPSRVNPTDLEAAVARAREMLPYFWAALDARAASDSEFLLKVLFPLGGGEEEGVWLRVVERRPDEIVGVVVQEYSDAPDVSQGRWKTFTEDRIEDWSILRDGLRVGEYTTRVELADMQQETAEKIRAQLGEAP